MAATETEERARSIAKDLRSLLSDLSDSAQFWRDRPYYPSRPETPPTLREVELRRAFRVFIRTVRVLRDWDLRTIPAVQFEPESLPSNPENPGLAFGTDITSEALREAWRSHRERKPRGDQKAGVIVMPLEQAVEVFSFGLAVALTSLSPPPSRPPPVLSQTSSAGTALVHFTVNSQNHNYRVHITERFWYSPVIFGSKLSTPVDDWVNPADYRLGGDQSGGSITWDQGIHTASHSRTSTTVTAF